MSRHREQDLKDIALLRNYVISVIATGVQMGREGTEAVKPLLAQLSASEALILDALEKR